MRSFADPVGGVWSERAIDLFEELSQVAQWKKLSARINGYAVKEKTRAKREGSPVPGKLCIFVLSIQC